MSVYIVTGSLGGGKSLMTVSKLKEYAKEGKRIAGNMDLDLKELAGSAFSKVSYTRVPDIPKASDLDALGRAYDGPYDDSKFGALVLDECALWLNSREWNDKDRKALITWLVHARKLGWDVFLLVQEIEMLDSQVRKALCEFIVTCHNINKVKIPILSGLWKLFTGQKNLPLPKIHVAPVIMGRAANPIRVDRWSCVGSDLYKAYQTDQIYSFDYAHGVHTVLSPWYVEGRYLPKPISGMSLLWRVPLLLFLKAISVLCSRWFYVSPTGGIYSRRLSV